MTFHSALSAGQLVKHRGDASTPARWMGDLLLSLDPCTTVMAARVNGAVTGSYAQISYDTVTEGAYTDIQNDQVIILSHTSSKLDAYLRLRVRKTPTSSIVYTSENSIDISNDDYLWVLNTYDITDRLSRPVSNVQYKDYELAYAGLQPVVRGIQTAYAGYVDSSSGKLRVAFVASSSYAAESGATISSYAYTFPSGTTVVSGATNTHTVTIDFDPGWYWCKLVVTDSGGRSITRRFSVAAHSAAYVVNTGFDNGQITRDENGHSLSIPAFTGVSTVLDRTFCIAWTDEYYNGTNGPIFNSISFVGWLRREEDTQESDPAYAVQAESRLEIAGIGAEMARLEMQMLALRNQSSPDEWDEIVNLTPWRAIVHILQRHSTVLNLCDLEFDSTDNTFLFAYLNTQGGNLLAAVNGLAGQINAALEFNTDGKLQVVRDPRYLSSAARSALTTIADWTNQDLVGVIEVKEHPEQVGKVDGDGAYYDSASGTTTAVRSRAPAHGVGSAEQSTSVNNQILTAGSTRATAEAELNQRTGNALSIGNSSIELTLRMADTWHWLTPSKGQVFTLTLDGSDAVRGLTFTTATKWFIKRVSVSPDNASGGRAVDVVVGNLTAIGSLGVTVPEIPDETIGLELPEISLPAFEFEFPEITFPEAGLTQVTPEILLPPPGKVAPTDGNCVIEWTSARLWVTLNYIKLAAPRWRDVGPSGLGDFDIKMAILDRFSTGRTAVGAYLLASDETDSKVYYAENIMAGAPEWTDGDSVDDEYNVIRACNAAGAVLIYAPSATTPGTQTLSYDFTANDGGWTVVSDTTIFEFTTGFAGGTYSAGVGWVSSYPQPVDTQFLTIQSNRSLSSEPFHTTKFRFKVTNGTNNFNPWYRLAGQKNDGSWELFTNGANNVSSNCAIIGTCYNQGTNVWTEHTVVTEDYVNIAICITSNSGDSVTVSQFEIEYLDTGAAVRYSSDYGETFASAVTVGDSPGSAGGFDVQRAGTVSYAAAHLKLRKATTLGGSYSDFVSFGQQVTCAIIPYYRIGSNSTVQTTASDPDVLVGLAAADGGSCIYKVTGAGVKTALTQPAVGAFVPGPNCLTILRGTKIAGIFNVSGTLKLYVSENTGSSWTFVRNLSSGAQFVRCRRNDPRNASNSGQLYVADSPSSYYSSKWSSNGAFVRTSPAASGIAGLDIWN